MHSSGTTRDSARIVIDRAGTIIEANAAFGITMRDPGGMIGTNALDVTAPADRDRCRSLLAKLCCDGEPVTTTKRMIRADGAHIWVRNHLSLIPDRDTPQIEVRIEPAEAPVGWVQPANLLRIARLVFKSRRGRTTIFGDALFGDQAWDMLLAAYISEAEGSVITIARVHAWTGIPLATGSRWIRALSAEGLLEYEDNGNHELVTTPFRLSSSAHRKFETYLSDMHENAVDGRHIAL